jgi:DNA repair exonuclease SbcCD ATPase subunit
MDDIQTIRKVLNKKLAELNVVRSSYKSMVENMDKSIEQVEASEEAQEIAQFVAQSVQQQAHQRIAEVVTRCLSSVFDEPYEFIVHFERKRGRTEARLTFQKEGKEIDPLDASGGGVVDVASFALRLSCLILNKPPLRRCVILDEPFKFVSKNHLPKIRDLIYTLSKEMGVQFIMVTHIQELKMGTIVEIGHE